MTWENTKICKKMIILLVVIFQSLYLCARLFVNLSAFALVVPLWCFCAKAESIKGKAERLRDTSGKRGAKRKETKAEKPGFLKLYEVNYF